MNTRFDMLYIMSEQGSSRPQQSLEWPKKTGKVYKNPVNTHCGPMMTR